MHHGNARIDNMQIVVIQEQQYLFLQPSIIQISQGRHQLFTNCAVVCYLFPQQQREENMPHHGVSGLIGPIMEN